MGGHTSRVTAIAFDAVSDALLTGRKNNNNNNYNDRPITLVTCSADRLTFWNTEDVYSDMLNANRCEHVYVCVRMCIYVYVCMCMYVCVRMYVCVCMYVYMHIVCLRMCYFFRLCMCARICSTRAHVNA